MRVVGAQITPMVHQPPSGASTIFGRATIDLHPVAGRKSTAAAIQPSHALPDPHLLVQGDSRQGLGHALAKAIGDAEINLSFVMAQVVGQRYVAMFGFENEADAARVAVLIKKAAAPVRRR